MIDYFTQFPEKCETELRTAVFAGKASESFPPGTYIFSEYFCPDLDCDCQRVLIKVLNVRSPNDRAIEVATISYTWDEHAEDWKAIVAENPNPYLDPLHFQAPFANSLLEFWKDMLTRDVPYAKRLQRHYAELRAAQSSASDSDSGKTRADKTHRASTNPALSKQNRKKRQRLADQKAKRTKR
jgi:hypothetical protein